MTRILLLALLFACTAPQLLNGALTALNAVCAERPNGLLTLARDALADGDLQGCCAYLKSYLIEYGDDPQVSALLTLIEAELAKRAPVPVPPLSPAGLNEG